jgi:hypothetical protein
MKSEQINELAVALAKTQAEIKGAAKDGVNPHFGKSYATLASVWDAIRVPLSRNGLSVSQLTGETEAGPTLETILMHTSGQWLQSEMLLRANKPDIQGLGSALTYARRYCLAAIVGVAPDDDDDGSQASNGAAPATKPSSRPKAPNPLATQPAPVAAQPDTSKPFKFANSKQQEFYDTVQAATGNSYDNPFHLFQFLGGGFNYADPDAWAEKLSAAVDHVATAERRKAA